MDFINLMKEHMRILMDDGDLGLQFTIWVQNGKIGKEKEFKFKVSL